MESKFSSNSTDLKRDECERETVQKDLDEKLSRVNKLAERVIDEMSKASNDQSFE
ncbi:hypothetical protein [Vibrio cholerae]|uniref:hypothetical protein n=1 Tax=Vibrio cholerae TaxID=666 RepID=UPI000AB98F04|nr:hypothetical protein [Vibrio cholerae]